ncbi:unnamed protein product, partial [Amoebophrya sp. A120]
GTESEGSGRLAGPVPFFHAPTPLPKSQIISFRFEGPVGRCIIWREQQCQTD